MKLVIVESPGKVKTISKILGPGYTVRPTVGHIIDLANGKGGDIGVDIQNNFTPKYEALPDKKDVIKAILDSARSADEILIACDNDREGESISFHVASQLQSLNKTTKRIVFNEITEAAIKKAVDNPIDFNHNLFEAQQARRVLDRIVGFMVSPYLSNKLGDKLSAGRVQSVALRMIVDREIEIEKFLPEVYYNISVVLVKTNDSINFIAKYPNRVTNDEEAERIRKDLETSTYKVLEIQEKKNIRKAPPPLTTSVLQQEASIKLKIKSEKTMAAAQKLYEAGHVTYIRTDSTRNSDESIAELRNFLVKNGYSLPSKPNEFSNKDSAQDAHEAIRPTNILAHPDTIALDGDEGKVYNLIWRTFVASQMTPAIFDVVKVSIEASAGQTLIAEGKIQREEGWMAVAKPFLKKDKEVQLPNILVGDYVSLTAPGVKAEKSQTKPPSRYSDASLIAELDRKNIGRPSTYASIISRISVRKYVKDTASGFFPTDLGRQIVLDLADNFTFMDYMYTADMEKRLDLIADGKLSYVDMISDFFTSFKQEFQKARGMQGMLTDFPCPKCGDSTVVRKSKYGFFAGCVKYKGGCDGIVNISIEDGVAVKKEQKSKINPDVKCPDCGSGMVPRPDGRFGPFYSCSNYPRCLGKRKIPFGKKCPDCGNELYATLMSNTMKLACMGYPNCKRIEELPEDADINWLDPKKVTPPVYSKKVERILK